MKKIDISVAATMALVLCHFHAYSICPVDSLSPDLIQIKVENYRSNRIYLYQWEEEAPIDSADLAAGFAYFYKTSKFTGYRIIVDNKKISFYKDETQAVFVDIDLQPEIHYKISNSNSNQRWIGIKVTQDSFLNLLRENRDSQLLFNRIRGKYENWALETMQAGAQRYPYMTLVFINHFKAHIQALGPNPDIIDQVKHVFLNLDSAVINSKTSIRENIYEELNYMSYLRVGSTIVDFAFPSSTGDTIDTWTFRGKYLLLDFWASWCGPCRKKSQQLKKLYNEEAQKNLNIMGVSLDATEPAWQYALKEDRLPWNQVIMPDKNNNYIKKIYNVYSIPKTILFSPSGEVLQINPSIEFLLELLK